MYYYPREFIKKIYHNIRWLLPKELAHKLVYRRITKVKLDFNNPKDLNQKIHYLIVHKYGINEAFLYNKINAKMHIKQLNIPDLHTAEIYKIYKHTNEIDFDILPQKFVVKISSGWNQTFICTDKSKLNYKEFRKKINKAFKIEHAKLACEYYTQLVQKEILIEEYLQENDNLLPKDYKFFCFNGKIECIRVDTDRNKELKRDFFDTNWNTLEIGYEKYKSYKNIDKPNNLKRMVEIVEILAKPFPFVRIDLYNIKGKIYFGEYTFSPAGGNLLNINNETLIKFGNLIDLSLYK
jgi:hypothetical protein